MHVNEATVVAQKSVSAPSLDIFYQLEECFECSLLKAITINSSEKHNFLVKTTSRVRFVVQNEDTVVCSVPFKWLDEQGTYSLNLTSETCKFRDVEPGPYELRPLIVVLLLYLFIGTGWILKRKVFSRGKSTNKLSTKKRIKSLDAFRGITIILMIFVNYGGGGYKYFDHKSWFGLNIADCIFPFFILIMGISLSVSTNSAVKKAENSLWPRIFTRSIKLFLIGICLNSDRSEWGNLRIPGVLQRFALSYLFAATFRILSCKLQNLLNKNLELPVNLMQKFYEYLVFLPEILMYIGSAAIYFYFTFFWAYSSIDSLSANCPKGYQGPGGLHMNSSYFNCTGGAANALDRLILGQNHLYQRSTAFPIYHNVIPHDPEGLLGTSTSILLTGFGVLIGILLIQARSTRSRITLWLVLSLLLGASALVFSNFNLIPICKNLWSFSFVTATGSIGLLTFLIFYILIDVKNIWSGLPFIYPGSNSILLYVGHSVALRYFPFYIKVEETSHYYLLARDLIGVHLWFIISYLLAKREIFITV